MKCTRCAGLKDDRECWVEYHNEKFRCLLCKRQRKKCVFPRKKGAPKSPVHKKRRTDSSSKPTRGKYLFTCGGNVS